MDRTLAVLRSLLVSPPRARSADRRVAEVGIDLLRQRLSGGSADRDLLLLIFLAEDGSVPGVGRDLNARTLTVVIGCGLVTELLGARRHSSRVVVPRIGGHVVRPPLECERPLVAWPGDVFDPVERDRTVGRDAGLDLIARVRLDCVQ